MVIIFELKNASDKKKYLKSIMNIEIEEIKIGLIKEINL